MYRPTANASYFGLYIINHIFVCLRNPNLEVATNKDWNASVSSQSKLKLVQNLVYQSWNVLKQSVLGRSCLMQRVSDLRAFKALRLYLVLWKIATNLEAQLWLYKYIISFKLSEEELEAFYEKWPGFLWKSRIGP